MMEILILWLIEFQMLELGPMLLTKKIGLANPDYWVERTKYIEDKLVR